MTLAEGVPGTWGNQVCSAASGCVFFLAHRMLAVCPCLGSITRCAGSMAQARTSLCMLHDHVWLVLSFVGVSLCDLSRCLLRTYQLLCV